MSKWAKISWLIAAIALVCLVSIRFVIGGWDNMLFGLVAVFLIGVISAIIVDVRFYLEFFTLRTTKHGLNMGTMILLGVVLIVSVNILAVKRDKTWDFTEEKLFSLSDQSRDVLKSLTEDLQMMVFYRGAKDQEVREQIKNTTDLYAKASKKVKVQFIDAFVDREKSQEYLQGLGDITDAVFFVEYKGKKVRVESPFDEEKTTASIIKSTRSSQKKIYFLTGHGERDIDSEDPEGLREFKNSSIGAAFAVEKLSLIDNPKIPEDAAVIAIVGPTTQLLENEMQLIRDFAQKGGGVLLALDPGLRHQGQLLTKSFGVEFLNNYLINDRVQIIGRGPAAGLGVTFDATHPITKSFKTQNFTLFDVSSELRPASNLPDGFAVTELVKTPPATFTVPELKAAVTPGDRKMVTVGIATSGKFNPAVQDAKEFRAVIFGDSDFIAQKDIMQGLNLDLAMNSIAFLADESDLISIRAKQPAGTKLELTTIKQNSFIIGGVAIPLLLFVMGGTVWYRRRGA